MNLIAAIIFWAALGLVFYTYILFPALLAVLARLFAKPAIVAGDSGEDTDAALPTVTMVVAAYNEAKVLQEKLLNTAAIDYPAGRFELLIGSDGSDDGTQELMDRLIAEAADGGPRIRVHYFKERRGKISVLNDLMTEVESDIVVMSDANTMFAADAIRKLVPHFCDPNVGCVSGKLSLDHGGGVSGEGLYWKYEGWIKRNESRLGFLIGCNGGIFALRRELYTRLPSTTLIEDFVLTLRVVEQGRMVRLEADACATEPACATSKAEMVRKIRIGAGGWQALGLNRSILHPRYGLRSFAFWGHKVMRWLVPCFLIAAFAANIVLARIPIYAVLLGFQVAGILMGILAYRAGEANPLPRWTRPFSYLFLMNYALLCGLLRFVFKKQRVTWERAEFVPVRSQSISSVGRETAPISE